MRVYRIYFSGDIQYGKQRHKPANVPANPVKQRAHNASLRTAFRTAVKKVLKAVEAGDKAAAQAVYQESVKVIDRIADKGVFHKTKTARHKSRLSAKVKALA